MRNLLTKSKILVLLCIGLSLSGVHANSNLLMGEKGAELDFSRELKAGKQLSLDDAFLIQLFSSWKALGALKPETNQWFQLIFSKEYGKAFETLGQMNEGKASRLKKPAELYLLYRLGYFQSFLKEWISFASKGNFLQTEMAMALDQVVGPQSSQILLTSGFSLTPVMEEALKKIENIDTRLNVSLQAFKALKSGQNAVKWIGKLRQDDELRLHLAHTAILSYGREGMLGASGKLIKKVVEPWMKDSDKAEELALYYMTLGRLLYQARAYKQAGVYYDLIPQSSRYFLQSRTESLWVDLQQRNFSEAMGELATLKLDIFEDQFYPEVHLASAIGHTMLCQFSDARNSIHQFIEVNKVWAGEIDQALKESKTPLPEENFYSQRMRRQVTSLKKEIKSLKEKGQEGYLQPLQAHLAFVKGLLREESQRQWKNRKKILESALYKMKFVRIELLSRMRAVAEGLRDRLPGVDTVKRFEAASLKQNQLSFPHDGLLWGDELFNMSADVRNECVQGQFYEK